MRVCPSTRFAWDKPMYCRDCHFWNRDGDYCRRGGLERCAYLLWNPPFELFPCSDCPYGKERPCVSFCMRKVLYELKEEKDPDGKEAS